jgi:hypothetical protein
MVFSDDLERLLFGLWKTRVWTYQEVLLASQPIAVSDLSHVPWLTFASALVFIEMSAGLPPLGSWTEIFNSRAHYRASMPNDLAKKLWRQDLTAMEFAHCDFGVRVS